MDSEDDGVILIIDDEPETVETYRLFLNEEYEVREATDGQEGLTKVDQETDIVLLDRKMPGLSGDEVLAEIRSRDLDCRVVMVTAVEPDLDLLHLDFDEYIVKPVTEKELRQVVDRMLERNSVEDRIQEMFALASKLAILEAKLDIDQLEQSNEYQELLNQFATLRDEVTLPDVEEDYYLNEQVRKFQTLLNRTQ